MFSCHRCISCKTLVLFCKINSILGCTSLECLSGRHAQLGCNTGGRFVFISIFYNQKLYTKENGHQIFSVMILKSVFMDMKGYDTLYMYLSRKKDAFSPPSLLYLCRKCLVVYSVIISFIVIIIFIIIIIIILNHAKNGHAN